MTSVFYIASDGKLTELRRTDYEDEALLQRLLAEHPAVLGGTGSADSRLLLIRREIGVPDEEAGPDRWALDHLFVDQDGVPVLVEVKRSSDPRARREVVAQMLDYAANGAAYWPIDRIEADFRKRARPEGQSSDEELAAFLSGGREPQAFWRQVEANLRAGRVRMVFVADRIARELERIVVFLNEQMRPAEVIAVEVVQFVGEDKRRMLVPRVLGNTDRAQASKSVSGPTQAMTEEEWLATLAAARGPQVGAIATEIIRWLQKEGFATGVTESTDAVYASMPRPGHKRSWLFFLRRSTGRFEISLQTLANTAAYSSDASRLDLLARVQALPGASTGSSKSNGWPSILLASLAQPGPYQALQTTIREVHTKVRNSDALPPS